MYDLQGDRQFDESLDIPVPVTLITRDTYNVTVSSMKVFMFLYPSHGILTMWPSVRWKSLCSCTRHTGYLQCDRQFDESLYVPVPVTRDTYNVTVSSMKVFMFLYPSHGILTMWPSVRWKSWYSCTRHTHHTWYDHLHHSDNIWKWQ